MGKFTELDKAITPKKPVQEPAPLRVLCVIPDEEMLNRQKFMTYLKKYPKARKFGFSEKHTREIEGIKARYGDSNSGTLVYGLPVTWNTSQTFLAC